MTRPRGDGCGLPPTNSLSHRPLPYSGGHEASPPIPYIPLSPPNPSHTSTRAHTCAHTHTHTHAHAHCAVACHASMLCACVCAVVRHAMCMCACRGAPCYVHICVPWCAMLVHVCMHVCACLLALLRVGPSPAANKHCNVASSLCTVTLFILSHAPT